MLLKFASFGVKVGSLLKNFSFHPQHTARLLKKMAHSSITSGSKHDPNQLIKSKSPYLLQHAYNPVNWYPWSEEALKKAKEENKLIFLSVGYSTCHWCHVMEKESFENEDIAAVMNENFINIKVDREERPDVDKMYMSFVQAISGRGGWPMSVWMTPELKPVYGGTYYPPDDRYYGQPGFTTILKSLDQQWKENPQKFKKSGESIMAALAQAALIGKGNQVPSASECGNLCFKQLRRSYEPKLGGFSEAPKFPQPVNMNFLLRWHVLNKGSDADLALDMCAHTLHMMAKGGIFDHVSLGFARYSTDEKWHVPHFEKMLYDQAQLASVYTDAYLLTKDGDFARIVSDILSYVSNDLSDPSGGFYSAEDADSYPEAGSKEKREGAFCVWTHKEIQSLLGAQPVPPEFSAGVTVSDIVCYHFDIRPNGNVDPYQDPHDELKGQNVLIVRGSEEETAAKFGLSLDVFRQLLKTALSTMREARQRRPRPHLDDKMLASWNGLMISAFAKAGTVLMEDTYVERAVKAAEFVRQHLFDQQSGRLFRSCYRGGDGQGAVSQIDEPIAGFLDDYAFVVRGLLDLYTACQDEKWIQWADELQQKQDDLFWDASQGGYFTSPAGDTSILIRLKEEQDGAEPSANSIAVGNLERLAIAVDRSDYHDKAEQTLCLFQDRLAKIPLSLPEMASALLLYEESPTEVVIVGPRSSDLGHQLYREAVTHQRSLLGQVVIRFDSCRPPQDGASFLASRRPSLVAMKPAKMGCDAAAYLCRNRSCSAPVYSPEDLRQLLNSQ
ncbi:spermatogenesis-associated protein 20 isoform X1 [Daphnia magna]|uniref:spermatogenesis-associated protein 20 isoform X1 n=2 Tax=Daphnia magna TaxID=35525 RepID=UPI001E1BACB7|nr:spermatogenesis-associated protein 20 isoform X1 [Daphnia magna]